MYLCVYVVDSDTLPDLKEPVRLDAIHANELHSSAMSVPEVPVSSPTLAFAARCSVCNDENKFFN